MSVQELRAHEVTRNPCAFVRRDLARRLERELQPVKAMTIGQLISDLYSKYERRYHDDELAAVATQVTLDDVLRARRLASRRARPTEARPV